MNSDSESPESESSSSIALDMYEACRLFWPKTRRRALHDLRRYPLSSAVADFYAAMCNLPSPIFSPEPCDWRISKAEPEHFRAALLAEHTTFLDVFLGEVVRKYPALEADFFAAGAPLGRGLRCRDLVLSATRFYRSWKKEPEDELFDCPFPPEIEAQARDFFPRVSEFLVQWALPRLETIEEAFRARILSDDYCVNLCVFSLINRTESHFKFRARYGPPLPQLLPAVACLRIQRELDRHAQIMAQTPDNEEQREAHDQVLGQALYDILEQYRELLLAHNLSKRAVVLDIYHFDEPKGPEAILGRYASFAKPRKK